MSQTFSVPDSVTHDQFITALQPLLDLLNVGPFEILSDVHVVQGSAGMPVIAVFSVTPDHAGSSNGPISSSEVPAYVTDMVTPTPEKAVLMAEHAETVWPILVEVV